MKIVVIGGSGLIGSKLVKRLREDGHDALAADVRTGGSDTVKRVDTITGEGLAEALEGAQVSSTCRTRLPRKTQQCWTSSRRHLASSFIGRIADSSTDGDTVRLPPALMRPEAADDVAAAPADVAANAPINGTVELAGPEALRLDELARRVLSASNDAASGDRRRPRTLLRRGARRPIPHPRRRPAHRPNPFRGLAQPLDGPAVNER
jgi:uncharacterized protein YbjT (DUF2867 family)